ncbi:hypothetical protein [Williamsia phyllosphaerae]|uniref:FG-GAP repeat protein n=1 Tax=Williamsia phyllosphaerae TaxID=885042 RepID=A0ABQ1UF71_9NOCA|nr:hypothetical protein [Williamsia phyllosphaerae]GGF16611.1 hypothetical protein GCM10007298_10790 [Williamsia phyllosphaerae]
MDFHILVLGPAEQDGPETPDDAENPDADAGAGRRSPITYGFGTGVGEMSSWTSAADHDLSGDGVPDAVRLDFDGDGSADDAMWDSDGDGRADLAVLDTDGDGAPDAYYSDTGRGLWDHRVTDPAAAVPPAGPAHAPDVRPGRASDTGAGRIQDRDVDVDGNGRTEIGLVFGGADPSPVRVLIDLDGDGEFDAALLDDDADGHADVWATRGQVRFEEGSARD